jgi:hypothetical protein
MTIVYHAVRIAFSTTHFFMRIAMRPVITLASQLRDNFAAMVAASISKIEYSRASMLCGIQYRK